MCSTIGAVGLSFRVRNGTGRFPHAMTAVTLFTVSVQCPARGPLSPLAPCVGVWGWCGPGGVGGGKSVVTTVTTVLYGVVVVVPVVGWEPHSGRVACLIFTHPLVIL